MKALYAWHERIRSFEVLRVLLLDLTMHLGIEKTFGVDSGEARSAKKSSAQLENAAAWVLDLEQPG